MMEYIPDTQRTPEVEGTATTRGLGILMPIPARDRIGRERSGVKIIPNAKEDV